MNFFKKLLSIINFFTLLQPNLCFVPNAMKIINSEQKIFNKILIDFNLIYHLQSARIKTFESAYNKLYSNEYYKQIYDLHDLIAFRYVFYTKEDLLKFYHHIKLEKNVMYTKNYIVHPKKNGYSAIHLRYENTYKDCPIKQLECQLYIIEDYYDSLYGNSIYNKSRILLK